MKKVVIGFGIACICCFTIGIVRALVDYYKEEGFIGGLGL